MPLAAVLTALLSGRLGFVRGAAIAVTAAVAIGSGSLVVAQRPECTQPSEDGCLLPPDSLAAAALADPGDSHLWWVSLPVAGDFRVALTDLAADYRMYIYGPDRSLVGLSTNPGTDDEVIDVPGAAPGRYLIIVDSPEGQVADAPYRLVWTWAAHDPSVSPPTSGPLVLLVDDFSDAGRGWLPRRSSPSEPHIVAGYEGGEYRITLMEHPTVRVVRYGVPGIFGDASIAASARLLGETNVRQVYLECRREGNNRYRFAIQPDRGIYSLQRWDGAQQVFLIPWSPDTAMNRGNESNRLELSCVGESISVGLNGKFLGSVQDDTYREGLLRIGAGTFADNPQFPIDARFDDLIVTGP